MTYDICVRLRACLVDQGPQYKAQRNLFPGKGLKSCRRLARMCGKPVVMGPVHCALAAGNPTMTLPTKVLSESLGQIGSLKIISGKSLFPIALGSCDHRITHQPRPINMNGRSILSVTSIFGRRTVATAEPNNPWRSPVGAR